MKKALIAAAAALSLAACGGDSTGSDKASGSLSFSYSGARSGSYSASGKYEELNGNSFTKREFAVATTDNSSGTPAIAMLSYNPVSSTRGDLTLFAFTRPNSAGTIAVDDDNCVSDDCPLGLFAFNVNPDVSSTTGETYYYLTKGTISVTAISSSNVSGTFQGKAVDLDSGDTLRVTNGSFNVPIVSGIGGLSSRTPVDIPVLRARAAKKTN